MTPLRERWRGQRAGIFCFVGSVAMFWCAAAAVAGPLVTEYVPAPPMTVQKSTGQKIKIVGPDHGLLFIRVRGRSLASGGSVEMTLDGMKLQSPYYNDYITIVGTEMQTRIIPHVETTLGQTHTLILRAVNANAEITSVASYYLDHRDNTKLAITHDHRVHDSSDDSYKQPVKGMGVDLDLSTSGGNDSEAKFSTPFWVTKGSNALLIGPGREIHSFQAGNESLEYYHATVMGSGNNESASELADIPAGASVHELKKTLLSAYLAGAMGWINHPGSPDIELDPESQFGKSANECCVELQNLGPGKSEESKTAQNKAMLEMWASRRLYPSSGADTDQPGNNSMEATLVTLAPGTVWDPTGQAYDGNADKAAKKAMGAMMDAFQNGRGMFSTYFGNAVLPSMVIVPGSDGWVGIEVEHVGQSSSKVEFNNGNAKTVKTVKGPGGMLAVLRFDEVPAEDKTSFYFAWITTRFGKLKSTALTPPIYPTHDPVRPLQAHAVAAVSGTVNGDPIYALRPMPPEGYTATNYQSHSVTLGADGAVTFFMGKSTPIEDAPGTDFRVQIISQISNVMPVTSPAAVEVSAGNSPDALTVVGTGVGTQEYDLHGVGGGAASYIRVRALAEGVVLAGVWRLRGTIVEGLGRKGPRTALVLSEETADDPFTMVKENDSSTQEDDSTVQILKSNSSARARYVHGDTTWPSSVGLTVSLKADGIKTGEFLGLVACERTFPKRGGLEAVVKQATNGKTQLIVQLAKKGKDEILVQKDLPKEVKLGDWHVLRLAVSPLNGGEPDAEEGEGHRVNVYLDDVLQVDGVFQIPDTGRVGVVSKAAAQFKEFTARLIKPEDL